jgi:transposase
MYMHPLTIVNSNYLEVHMSLYNHFIGIDIGKSNFVVAIHNSARTKEYENDPSGIKLFIKEHKTHLKDGLVVLETTGGYETRLLLTLCDYGYKVHRANTRKVKSFVRSYGNGAKTDNLDAKALARYGVERVDGLELFKPCSDKAMELYELIMRRQDLKSMLVAEKNRFAAPRGEFIRSSYDKMIKLISEEINYITDRIKAIINSDAAFKAKQEVIKTIPGIGDIVAFELLVLMPELGSLSRRQIASLAGVAPRANDSGRKLGYRYTAPGRGSIKPILFLAAMAARNSKTTLKSFYEKLIERGKKKMVALVALMRHNYYYG